MKTCFVIFAVLFLTNCADDARNRPIGGNGFNNPSPIVKNDEGDKRLEGNGDSTKLPPSKTTEKLAQSGETNTEVCPHKDETMCKIWETLKGTGEGFYQPTTTHSTTDDTPVPR